MALQVILKDEELFVPAIVPGEVGELPSVLEQLDKGKSTKKLIVMCSL